MGYNKVEVDTLICCEYSRCKRDVLCRNFVWET
jgi:hypothetical protein